MGTWADVLPDYEVMPWNDDNIPRDSNWFRAAARLKPVNAHNYMLIWSAWKYGGVAMDNDVEVIRPFDLEHGLFVGFQKDKEMLECVNNCVVGAIAGHPLLRRILDRMELRRPTDEPVWMGPGMVTAELHAIGMRIPGMECKIGDVMIYGKERLSPFFHDEPRDRAKITTKTFAVHHFEGSWAVKPK